MPRMAEPPAPMPLAEIDTMTPGPALTPKSTTALTPTRAPMMPMPKLDSNPSNIGSLVDYSSNCFSPAGKG
jgi:hypothetical protein